MTGMSASSRAKRTELGKFVLQTLRNANRSFKMNELFDTCKEGYKDGFTQVWEVLYAKIYPQFCNQIVSFVRILRGYHLLLLCFWTQIVVAVLGYTDCYYWWRVHSQAFILLVVLVSNCHFRFYLCEMSTINLTPLGTIRDGDKRPARRKQSSPDQQQTYQTQRCIENSAFRVRHILAYRKCLRVTALLKKQWINRNKTTRTLDITMTIMCLRKLQTVQLQQKWFFCTFFQ